MTFFSQHPIVNRFWRCGHRGRCSYNNFGVEFPECMSGTVLRKKESIDNKITWDFSWVSRLIVSHSIKKIVKS
jgi:hypothetical protein